jgi:hypothetical protein
LSFSNDDAVDTWGDLSSNNRDATQASSSSRPVFKTNVQGGNPVVRFDGSNDILETSSFSTPTAATCVMALKANDWTSSGQYRGAVCHAYGSSANILTEGISFLYLTNSNEQDWLNGDYLAFGNGYQNGRSPRAIGPMSSGSDFRISSTVLSSNNSRIFINGSTASSRVEALGSIGSVSGSVYIGGAGPTVPSTQRWQGDIGSVVYFPSQLSFAMMRRLEHAASYSFKISC